MMKMLKFWDNFPPRGPDGRYSIALLFRGWLMLMVPIAAVVFAQTGSVLLSMLAFIHPPAMAILQGALGILSYRLHYCDSPKPHTPAHGLVIVNPNDKISMDDDTSTSNTLCLNIGCSCLGGRRWRRGGPYTRQQEQVLSRASKEAPLRLLVIGDSLAIGVGTTRSCCPMLPETIARTLSKEHGGRPVLWTSHGGVGASAGWVVRELQRGIQRSTRTTQKKPSSAATLTNAPELEICSDVSSEESSLVDNTEDNMTEEGADDVAGEQYPIEAANKSQVNWQEWRNCMARHQKRFDPDIKGPYDVVVVLTGSNDLKAACFPFLLTGDDLEFHKQAQKRGGAYSTELRRLLLALSQRMKVKLQGEDENDNTHPPLETRKGSSQAGTRSSVARHSVSVDTSPTCPAAASQPTAPPTPSNFKRPLIVLPGNPASVIPCFNVYPLKWLTVPIVSSVDNSKRDVADDNPRHVLFVEPPTSADIGPFEAQEGHIWERREKEDTLISLRQGSCQGVEAPMRSYYDQKHLMYGHRPLYQNDDDYADPQTAALVPKLSERPGRMGSKIFSVDGVHPNDEGFEFWGRYIGDAIVKELRRKL